MFDLVGCRQAAHSEPLAALVAAFWRCGWSAVTHPDETVAWGGMCSFEMTARLCR